ncbi:DUF1801 domain-containing protein [Marinomonas agarivorans]|nr:DUF1801 domain-containing protein [Marinomonas agarivorans]
MHPDIEQKYQVYPAPAQDMFLQLRALLFATADNDMDYPLEETTKWGEPSYIMKGGTTIRLDWKSKTPDYFCIFFNCKTKMVATIKELYGDTFLYQGSRAIMFSLAEPLPEQALKHCFFFAMRYHKLKHLPLLGG